MISNEAMVILKEKQVYDGDGDNHSYYEIDR